MNVVRHYNEGMKLKAALLTVLEKRCNKQFGIGCSLKVPMLLERRDRYSVSTQFLANGSHEKSIPQGLKPLYLIAEMRGPSLKAWRT
ncbi:MAG: hypothetical protein FWD64_06865 [Acidobacteriaceae bacterium]|nr:hypothetical protein [Acidobacteriaceae bacterium]